MPILSKPLVVPQFGNFNQTPIAAGATTLPAYSVALPPYTVNLFVPNGTGAPTLYQVDLASVYEGFGLDPVPTDVTNPNAYIPSPNACAAQGVDLYVSISAIAGVGPNPASAAILKLTDYFKGYNTTANVKAGIFTDSSNGYCGLAADGAGKLYAVENGSEIYSYTTTSATPVRAAILTGTSQANPSNFGDIAFDGSGNLWVADYNNNSVLVLPKATLGGSNAYAIATGSGASFPVANSNAGLATNTSYVFASPEGVGFDGSGNLWVGNNNDGDEPGNTFNTFTSLVRIAPSLLGSIVSAASPAGGKFSLTPGLAGLAIYQVPTPLPPTSYSKSAQFGGLQIDTISATDLAAGKPEYLYVNDEVGPTVQQFDVNPNSATFLESIAPGESFALTLNDAGGNPVVTNPGNGGIALVNASLVIGDDAGDTGAEPDTGLPLDGSGNPIFWESPNIGVGTSATPPSDFSTNGSIEYSASGAYVYVNVRNFGCTDTMGTERLRVYWASGAMSLSWPAPWTEIPTNEGNIGVIQAGASAAISTFWATMPDPAIYGPNTHYCLLARVETTPVYPFGMTYWEKTQSSDPGDPLLLSYNAVNNSKISQRNIYIGPPGGGGIVGGFRLGNLLPSASLAAIRFQLLNSRAEPISIRDSRLVVRAEVPIFNRLAEAEVSRLSDGGLHVLRPEEGIGRIVLEPGETLRLNLEFTPHDSLSDYALRAMQYEEIDGKQRLVGGQTFVSGKVEGFSLRRERRRY
jgi:hypothetical protein